MISISQSSRSRPSLLSAKRAPPQWPAQCGQSPTPRTGALVSSVRPSSAQFADLVLRVAPVRAQPPRRRHSPLRVKPSRYASSVSARRDPDSPAVCCNGHPSRVRPQAWPHSLLQVKPHSWQGNTPAHQPGLENPCGSKRTAAESPRALRRLALPTAVCSLHVGPALPQSAPNVTQTNRPASASAPA
jgi:hypothetical protein